MAGKFWKRQAFAISPVPSSRVRRSVRFGVALIAALLIHSIAASLFPYAKEPPIEPKMHVTYLRIERRPAPPLPPPPTQPRVAVQPVHVEPPPRRELAKIDRHALVYQPPRSRITAPTHATLPQVDYNATIAKLRSAMNPVAAARSATQSVQTKHYAPNMQAAFGSGGDSEGILTPVNSWSRGGYHWYYVRYYVQYQDGSVETGVVPWPLRYLPSQDPFALDYQHFPLPKPLPNYTPEAGAPMRPLIAFCWEHRSQVVSCPIEHD